MKKSQIIFFTTASLVILLIVGAYYYLNYCRFSKEDWKNNTNRQHMVKSIINSKLIDNKSINETKEILGDPDYCKGTEYLKGDSSTVTLVYLTGGGKWIDLETLCVDINNDTVQKVYIEYD